MADEPVEDETVTVIERIYEDDEVVVHQWTTTDGEILSEYRGYKRVLFLKDFWENLYG